MNATAYAQGKAAFIWNKKITSNPFAIGSKDYDEFVRGYEYEQAASA